MRELRVEMKRSKAEIDRLKAASRRKLAEIDALLKACWKQLSSFIRSAFLLTHDVQENRREIEDVRRSWRKWRTSSTNSRF